MSSGTLCAALVYVFGLLQMLACGSAVVRRARLVLKFESNAPNLCSIHLDFPWDRADDYPPIPELTAVQPHRYYTLRWSDEPGGS